MPGPPRDQDLCLQTRLFDHLEHQDLSVLMLLHIFVSQTMSAIVIVHSPRDAKLPIVPARNRALKVCGREVVIARRCGATSRSRSVSRNRIVRSNHLRHVKLSMQQASTLLHNWNSRKSVDRPSRQYVLSRSSQAPVASSNCVTLNQQRRPFWSN